MNDTDNGKSDGMKKEETLAGRYVQDQEIIQRLETLIEASGRPFREVAEAFPAYIRRYNLTRFLAYYELFRMIKDTPGYIVECGIYRGFSLFSLGKFLEIFSMGDKSRKVIGFDNFQGFTEIQSEDGPALEFASKDVGGWSAGGFREEFFELLDIFHQDAFAPWAKRIWIVEGNVEETIPKYVAENPGLRISLLHLDIDLYQPTSVALEHFYDLVVPGGVVVLDEYALIAWPGESKALEDFFAKRNQKMPKLNTFNWVGNPNCYFTKE